MMKAITPVAAVARTCRLHLRLRRQATAATTASAISPTAVLALTKIAKPAVSKLPKHGCVRLTCIMFYMYFMHILSILH